MDLEEGGASAGSLGRSGEVGEVLGAEEPGGTSSALLLRAGLVGRGAVFSGGSKTLPQLPEGGINEFINIHNRFDPRHCDSTTEGGWA